MSDKDQNEHVGYQNPPRHSRFKPGQSGNPDGRPRNKLKSFKECVLSELAVKIVAIEDNKRYKMTKRAMIMRSLINDFARHDKKLPMALMQALISIEEIVDSRLPDKMIISWAKPTEPPEEFRQEKPEDISHVDEPLIAEDPTEDG